MEFSMHRSRTDAPRRKVDNALTIQEIFNGRDFAFDFVIADLRGDHPTVVNRASDRVYFVLDGNGTVTINWETKNASKDDLFIIPKKTPHSLSGNLTYVIITSPPFDPANEELIR